MSESVAGTAPETESVDEQPFAVERELTAREAAVAALRVVVHGLLGAAAVWAVCAFLGLLLSFLGFWTSELGTANLIFSFAGVACAVSGRIVAHGAERLGRGDR